MEGQKDSQKIELLVEGPDSFQGCGVVWPLSLGLWKAWAILREAIKIRQHGNVILGRWKIANLICSMVDLVVLSASLKLRLIALLARIWITQVKNIVTSDWERR